MGGEKVETVSVRKSGKKLFEAREAKGFFEKTLGIMFSRKCFRPLLLEFSRQARAPNSIHSLFCPPFDAVFLNERRRVIEVVSVKPFSFVTPRRPAKYLLELPAGEARRKALREGDALKW